MRSRAGRAPFVTIVVRFTGISPVRCTPPAKGPAARRPAGRYSASCWYAVDWKDMRCSGETPMRAIASRCSGVE